MVRSAGHTTFPYGEGAEQREADEVPARRRIVIHA